MEAQESRLGCQTYSPRVGTNPIKVLFRPSDFKNCVLNLNHLVNCNRLPQSLILLLRFRFFHYTLNGSILKLVSTSAPEDQRQSSLSDIVPFKSICLFFISSFFIFFLNVTLNCFSSNFNIRHIRLYFVSE